MPQVPEPAPEMVSFALSAYHAVYVSVGSNMGDRLANCRNGIDKAAALPRSGLVTQSAFYETQPVDFTRQDWFVNAVFKLETLLEPLALLSHLQSIQAEAGRLENTVRFGPRVLDLDILLFDQLILSHPDLTLPHPRMHKRRFVLVPMCDIDPSVRHPVLQKTAGELLAGLNLEEQALRRIDA